jgi:hypothetical protein
MESIPYRIKKPKTEVHVEWLAMFKRLGWTCDVDWDHETDRQVYQGLGPTANDLNRKGFNACYTRADFER